LLLPFGCHGVGCLLGEFIEVALLDVVLEQLSGSEYTLDLSTRIGIARTSKGRFASFIIERLMMRIPAARIVL
jgi:hypothetical protein